MSFNRREFLDAVSEIANERPIPRTTDQGAMDRSVATGSVLQEVLKNLSTASPQAVGADIGFNEEQLRGKVREVLKDSSRVGRIVGATTPPLIDSSGTSLTALNAYVSDRDFIRALYRSVVGREPTTKETSALSRDLQTGARSRLEVIIHTHIQVRLGGRDVGIAEIPRGAGLYKFTRKGRLAGVFRVFIDLLALTQLPKRLRMVDRARRLDGRDLAVSQIEAGRSVRTAMDLLISEVAILSAKVADEGARDHLAEGLAERVATLETGLAQLQEQAAKGAARESDAAEAGTLHSLEAVLRSSKDRWSGYARAIKSTIGTGRVKTVYELGAGTGPFVAYCRQNGLEVIGLEPNEALRREALEAGINLRDDAIAEFIQHRPASSVGALVVRPVSPLVASPEALAKLAHGAARVLVPGGVLLVELAEADNIDLIAAMENAFGHLQLLTRDEASGILSGAGLSVSLARRPQRKPSDPKSPPTLALLATRSS